MNRPKVYKILLLEDDESTAKLLLHTLERYNFDVTHVVDGMSGLTKIRNNSYDLVISDVNMPYLDGISFLEKGKEMLKMTPVIMLTAVGEKDQVRRAAFSHVTAYLLKPIANQALLEKIAQVLQLKPENIIDKKEFPLVINVSELSISQMLLEIKGCPGKKSLEEIYDRFMLSLAGRGTFTNLRINLDKTFFYEVRALQILDDLTAKILKHTNIRASSFFLDSEFFNDNVVNLQPYSYLSEVNIISK
ncbi:response regulator [Leptospira perdikensis]|uniref:Response regulator n=1 Tax=Leptospira perdikensis TaxID=2484948 RepID=A0A4R9JIY9_9LEPT|nr:response regulator [Leptospira perdikensis]TGL44188.1 response regulator [Leptospira perdikensis]